MKAIGTFPEYEALMFTVSNIQAAMSEQVFQALKDATPQSYEESCEAVKRWADRWIHPILDTEIDRVWGAREGRPAQHADVSDDGVTTVAVTVEPEMVVDLSAGELREMGMNGIPDEVPDCAMLRNENGRSVFRWINLTFTIAPDGTITTSDGTVIPPKAKQ